ASAEPVARRGGREQGAGGRAGGGLARRPLHVLLTGAGPVALGVGPAGHGTLVDAGVRRIGAADGDVGAGAQRAAERAGPAGPRADVVAADALGAEPAQTLSSGVARGPDGLLPARQVVAGVGRQALGVGGAGAEALATVADVRAAR